jgi:organic hydroperoxide reductase OsmC/OhrA
MSDERTHHVTVRLAHDYEFVAEFGDIPSAPAILFDEPEPLGTNQAPSAAAVLGAAVGNCLSASLAFCLRRAHIELENLTASVSTHVTRNEKGRYRISQIDVELSPVLRAGDGAKLERCEGLFKDFCTVTASVQHGIPVHVSLKQHANGDVKVA